MLTRLTHGLKVALKPMAASLRMLSDDDRIFFNLYGQHDWHLETAQKHGVWHRTREIMQLGPEKIVEDVIKSGMRGRGGAGFPTGLKWSFMPKASDGRPSYFIVNADEGEPGTCKDREIIRKHPHMLLEGTLLSGYACRARAAYIFVRGEFVHGRKVLEEAIEEAKAANLLGKDILGTGYDFDIFVHPGGGSYVCGEESALMESLEGKPGRPRVKPPFPAQVGLFGCPTTINNVETVASIPTIMRRGPEWYTSLGRGDSCGTKLFCVSGHVNNPIVVEEELGIPMKELLETHCGGVRGGWDNLLAVIPGGASTPILSKEQCEAVTMDYGSLKAAGSDLGTGALIVMDKATDPIRAIRRLSHFYVHESCGQCTPCREGSTWIEQTLRRIEFGHGSKSDLQFLNDIAGQVEGQSLCALSDAAVWVVQGLLKNFPDEVNARINTPYVHPDIWLQKPWSGQKE